jgi:hypothetical protein
MSTNKTSPEGGIADLARERSSASFPVSQMFEYLSGGKENAAKVLKLQQIIEKDPVRTSFTSSKTCQQNHFTCFPVKSLFRSI